MQASSQVYRQKRSTFILVTAMLVLAGICGVSSRHWVGVPFPGFFCLENRVVASVALPHWPIGARRQVIYQAEVTAVNGQPIASAAALYSLVRHIPPGSAVTYTLRKDGHTFQLELPTLVFTLEDYVFIFTAYMFTALTIAFTGIVVWFLTPSTPASRAFLIASLVTGVFGLTGTDLYFPYRFFRLHVLAEALLPAGYLHLALVFPTDRSRRLRSLFLLLPYGVSGVLALVYELFLYHPARYSQIHNLCMIYVGIAAPLFLLRFVWEYFATNSHLVRQRIRVMILGFLLGYGFPAMLMLCSGLLGGEIAVNYMAFTAFLFPVSIGYAIVKHDLFEIETFLKRGIFYSTLTAALTLTYFGCLAILNVLFLPEHFVYTSLFPLFFTLSAILLLNPLKEHLQQAIDRVFFRLSYNPKQVLERTSATLASTLRLEEILPLIWGTIGETVCVRGGGIFLLTPNQKQYRLAYPTAITVAPIAKHHPWIVELGQQRRSLTLYDVPLSSGSEVTPTQSPCVFSQLGVQILVPLWFQENLQGFLALGAKENATFFSAEDIAFLSTLANQGALSLASALACQEIQELNVDLQKKVEHIQAQEQEAAHSRTQLRHLSARLLHLQEEEYERIGRELHDHLGQILTATGMDIKWAKKHCPEDLHAVHERLQEAAYLVQIATRTTRELSVSLRPEILNERGLEVALKRCAMEFERRSGLPVQFLSKLRRREIPLHIATNVYRIVQEALTNVARHAEANQVTMVIDCSKTTLRASVSDNGVGFEDKTLSDPHALGLVGMQERARLLGGRLDICSAPGAGVVVQLEIPLTEGDIFNG